MQKNKLKLNYKNAIFDADGTLLDTVYGIHAGFNYAMDKMGRPKLEFEAVKSFMGPSILSSLQGELGFSETDAKLALNHYRDYYWTKGYAECKFFDGVLDMLHDLKKANCILCVATNKPQIYIEKILKELGVHSLFATIAGPDFGVSSSDKTPLVKKAICDKNAVMIGDRYFDIEAAKNASIDSVGVEWGSASAGEFIKYKPTHIAATPKDVANIILGK